MAAIPQKPPGWKKPQRHYGGEMPGVIEGPHGEQPDLLTIGAAIVFAINRRREKITTPGYCMKVRDSCPYACCQYLQSQEEEEHQQKIIIKKIIRKRRSTQAATAAPNQQQATAEAQEAAQRQWQEAEAERQRQLAEQQRQQQEEAERQRQAAAAAAAAPPAVPTQKVAIFQNTGTDPAMAQAELYYESTRWGPLGHGDPPVSVGTFPGHRWFIVANGMYAKLFTVGEEAQQHFTF